MLLIQTTETSLASFRSSSSRRAWCCSALETCFVSFGDPRNAWNDHVAEHYAPTLAPCVSRALQFDEAIRCQMHVGPLRELMIPLYPDVCLTKVPPEEEFDGTTDRWPAMVATVTRLKAAAMTVHYFEADGYYARNDRAP